MAATPASSFLKARGIAFALLEYRHDPRAEGYGMEAAEKLGLDAASLERDFPSLVSCALTAYSRDTPLADRPYGESLVAARLGSTRLIDNVGVAIGMPRAESPSVPDHADHPRGS